MAFLGALALNPTQELTPVGNSTVTENQIWDHFLQFPFEDFWNMVYDGVIGFTVWTAEGVSLIITWGLNTIGFNIVIPAWFGGIIAVGIFLLFMYWFITQEVGKIFEFLIKYWSVVGIFIIIVLIIAFIFMMFGVV